MKDSSFDFTPVQQELEGVLELLKLEQKEDLAWYKLRSQQKSIAERVAFGITWFPIRIVKEELGFGGKLVLEVERVTQRQGADLFQTGRSVALFGTAGGEKDTINGIITSLRRNRMRIALNREELPDWADEGKIGVNLLFDETSYKEMERSTRLVQQASGTRLAELRDILLGAKPAAFHTGNNFEELPQLNESQNRAVQNILNAKDVAIIHGPPGTGKTTTLVQAIKATLRSEKQVLVCAPSNTAVDLLTERLAFQEVSVMRLGHPSRVSDTLLHHTLEGQIMDHSAFKDLKNVRRQAEEYRGMANKYKRHFGWEEREQRRMLIAESKKLRAEAELLERYITDQLLDTTQVICCTLVGANSRLLHDKRFSTVFIDEAAQALEPGCWIPIRKADKVVFAGDHRQLPPTIKSMEAERGGLGKTLMEKCIERQPVSVMLQTQYRMNEQIMQFSSEQFYDNALEAHESVRHHVLPELMSEKTNNQPVEYIDTAGCGFQESAEAEGSSTANPEEAELVLRHLRALLAAMPDSDEGQPEDASPLRIGVISPYRAQINYLKEQVESDPQLNALKLARTLHLGTVDSFQGQERDVIYISMVRSNSKGEIGFLQDIRRMNVALTRARKKLVIVGDSGTIGSHPFYQAFLEYIDRIGTYKSAWEWVA